MTRQLSSGHSPEMALTLASRYYSPLPLQLHVNGLGDARAYGCGWLMEGLHDVAGVCFLRDGTVTLSSW